MATKKKQQLKKLEELASKYNERNQKTKEEIKKTDRKNIEKSHIPISKACVKNDTTLLNKPDNGQVIMEENKDDEIKVIVKKNKPITKFTGTTIKDTKINNRKHATEIENKRQQSKNDKKSFKLVKESSMSLDSLEDNHSNAGGDKNCHSIGINTELVCPCIPCVIYDNLEPKNCKKSKNLKDSIKLADEPKVELLYKNLTMVSSTDIGSKHILGTEDSKEEISCFDHHVYNINTYNSDNCISDYIESNPSVFKSRETMVTTPAMTNSNEGVSLNINMINPSSEKLNEDIHNLSAEHFENHYDHDIDDDIYNNEENNDDELLDKICRHGSGDTYTKFTENQTDLEEFINITDKMMGSHYAEERENLEKELVGLHTPRTKSLEAVNAPSSDDVVINETNEIKCNFSNTIQDLKKDLKELLNCASSDVDKTSQEPTIDNHEHRKVCDMEHITIYQLNSSEKGNAENERLKIESSELKLPSITETNKPRRKATCTKDKLHTLYKPYRKYKMLGEQKRDNTENQTFIVKEIANDTSDGQSTSPEGPPLKLPRIDNKRLE
jgi:hypothetical protein